MAFIDLTRDLFENVTFTLSPKVHFVSSSSDITGSEYVSPVRSKCIKTVADLEAARQNGLSKSGIFDLNDWMAFDLLDEINGAVRNAIIANTSVNVRGYFDTYLTAVNDSPKDARFSKYFDIFRFDPDFKYTVNTSIKNSVRKVLMPYYRHEYDNCSFSYTNYNTLNFFTASMLPENSALIYPNISDAYTPDQAFTLQFWINPRYTNDHEGAIFNAGSIFHMSSSICVSLHSGSSKDVNGLINKFKIAVQLSQSCDTKPSKINFNNLVFPNDMIFTSSFNLSKNSWHHVSVRWHPRYNNGSGSIVIDSNEDFFYINSSSITTSNKAVVLGNYYDGPSSNIYKFFNATVSADEGIVKLNAGTSDPTVSTYSFDNLLNAEIHEIKLYNDYKTDFDLLNTGSGVSSYNNLLFYVPPFFYPETSDRQCLETPFQKVLTSSYTPFNARFSFGVGGKEINLENFTREYIQKLNPRLLNMTSLVVENNVENLTAEQYVYASGSILRRNFTILPNDNGQFNPDYFVLKDQITGSLLSSFDGGINPDYSQISLTDLIHESSINTVVPHETSDLFGSVLTILQRTRDTSSNEVVVFDISNLFYGNCIGNNSFELIDTNLTGSTGKLKFTIKDNGRGSLYRSDCNTKVATWPSLGNIFYNEGMILIKTPHLPLICKDKTEIKLSGKQNIHSLVINVPCPRSYLNSSSNPTFVSLPKSDNENDKDTSTLQLTSVNIHDENFNIIMRANFAQPILKDNTDEFIIRLKKDF